MKQVAEVPCRSCTPAAGLSLLMLTLLSSGALAQQPVFQGSVTVTGVIREAGTGVPVPGAHVILHDSGPSAFSDDQGRFRLSRVSPGLHRMSVRRFGYMDRELEIMVTDPMGELDVRIEPDPIQLQQIEVEIENVRADLRGLVLDAVTGEPVPWVELQLTRDAVTAVGRRQTSNEEGAFEVPEVVTGAYLLRVEKLDYEPQYRSLLHTVAGGPVEVRLQPDVSLQEGLAIMRAELIRRQNAWGRQTRVFDEEHLRRSGYRSMGDFLQFGPGTLGLTFPCVGTCLYIDDMPVVVCPPPARPLRSGGRAMSAPAPDCPVFPVLSTYNTRDFYRLEVFECRGRVPARGTGLAPREYVFFAYTYGFMERMGREPRMIPPLIC